MLFDRRLDLTVDMTQKTSRKVGQLQLIATFRRLFEQSHERKRVHIMTRHPPCGLSRRRLDPEDARLASRTFVLLDQQHGKPRGGADVSRSYETDSLCSRQPSWSITTRHLTSKCVLKSVVHAMLLQLSHCRETFA